MNEEWRDIPGFNGRYAASSHGNVRGPRGVMAPGLSSNGYVTVFITSTRGGKQRSWLVQDLVMLAFVGPKPEGTLTLHGPDATKTNNRLENLRYDTPRENALDIARHGRRKLNAETVATIRARRAAGESGPAIARAFRIDRSQVYEIAKGRQYGHV